MTRQEDLDWIRGMGAKARASRPEAPALQFYTLEEWRFIRTRPDLPPCERCGSGTKCGCEVFGSGGWCACMGFTGCPECPRGKPLRRG